MFRLIVACVLIALIFGVCSKKVDVPPTPPAETKSAEDLRRLTVEDGTEVTFYPAYGYRSGDAWMIPIRAWTHENFAVKARVLTELAERKLHALAAEAATLKFRVNDFTDDDESGEKVTIEFKSDPEQEKYFLGESDRNGLIRMELRLPVAKAQKLLQSQGSSQWLTYRAVSSGHTGQGRIRLIEPEGVSVISDIDDTIKITEVPGETVNALRNTLCREFVAAPGMEDMYRELDGVAFHYVSGGPWQLFGPLYDFLIPSGKYPEGSFHFGEFPKNPTERETLDELVNILDGLLQKTYDHKVASIESLLERFPARKFILIGDSGELDPEVYRTIKNKFPDRIQEIRIRDVVNDNEVNPDRMAEMNKIKVEPVLCARPRHHEKMSTTIRRLNGSSYAVNKRPPCG